MRVSVLLPAHNAEPTLREAVESVLAQTYRDFELVLIDDGSTDGTRGVLDAFAGRDPRVRVVAHENVGMGAALNRAMATVDAEWVARMDADDVMLPTRLERQVAFLEAHPGLAVASCLVYYVNREGDTIAKSTSDLLTPGDLAEYVRASRLIAVSHPGAIMNRRAVLAVGGYRPQFWPSEDIDLWNRLAEAGHAVLVQPEYLLKYRIHASSVCVAQPHLATRQIRWVRACMVARRSGLPEPSLEEFVARDVAAPWPMRLNQQRKDLAHVLYKSAVHHYGTSRYRHLVVAFAGSLLLEPLFVIRRLWSRVVRHRFVRDARRAEAP